MAEQYDFGQIAPTTKSGAALAADLNAWRNALNTMHRGAARPGYAQPGMLWIKEVSTTTWEIYLWTGSRDILFASFNPTLDHWTVGALKASGVPAAALTQGAGSGLDADKVDGLEAAQLRRSGTSVEIAQGQALAFGYSVRLNGDDATISARRHGPGLNIVGLASEGNGVRYIRSWGEWSLYGGLEVTGELSATGGPIVAQNGNRVGAEGTVPALEWKRPGISTWAALLEPSTNFLYFWRDSDANFAFAWDGNIWARGYGWLHDRFAHRWAEGDMGGARIEGNCGNDVLRSGYEVYDRGDGVHRVRVYQINCSNCIPTNCACQCADGDGGSSGTGNA